MKAVIASVMLSTLMFGMTLPAESGEWEHARDGFIIGANLGGGSADLNEDGMETSREAGVGGNFRIGWALRPDLASAFEASVWSSDVDGVTWTFSVAGPALTWFPSAQGWFVRGGVGVGTIEADFSEGSRAITLSDQGFGVFGAAGYEWRLTRKFAMGPELDFGWMDVGEGLTSNFVNGSLAFNWYFQ